MVDVDSFRPFYPNYLKLQQRHGRQADDLVQADARKWLDKSLDYLIEHRANIIVEHGLRDQEVTDALLAKFSAPANNHTAGADVPYRVEAAFLAVPAAESRLGMLERYQLSYEHGGLGRYVAEEVHDSRYQHLLTAADWLDADQRVAAASIYRRGPARGSDAVDARRATRADPDAL